MCWFIDRIADAKYCPAAKSHEVLGQRIDMSEEYLNQEEQFVTELVWSLIARSSTLAVFDSIQPNYSLTSAQQRFPVDSGGDSICIKSGISRGLWTLPDDCGRCFNRSAKQGAPNRINLSTECLPNSFD